ncbi:lipocalin family protein [Oceanispirochaeta sp.]|jgi:apolipoprotein D and lipocalin family protein|uniref:lipocalin family protein n=1 Tax=Oceanispirochaeta sp. TaxID=2035350 RepID=UPI00262A9A15|nr:lipocalin family protein [Oceanispirochaeta sp.]MDA3958181.1 lipocalin family protein [Oceanispirochaeta sp.]
MKIFIPIALIVAFLSSCATSGKEPFHKTAEYIDLESFSGDWYVIALLPTIFEKKAANGIENYSLTEEGNIRVKYTFRKGSPQGKEKIMYQDGWVYNNESNADWRVRPLWPLKLPYYILEIDEQYQYTVIGTNNYKYLWIMSRNPDMDEDLLKQIINRMTDRGYDMTDLMYMKQNWDSQ